MRAKRAIPCQRKSAVKRNGKIESGNKVEFFR